MKTELKRTIEITSVFEAPLYGYNIVNVYSEKQKLMVKELLNQLISDNLEELEYSDESVKFKLTSSYTIKSLNKD